MGDNLDEGILDSSLCLADVRNMGLETPDASVQPLIISKNDREGVIGSNVRTRGQLHRSDLPLSSVSRIGIPAPHVCTSYTAGSPPLHIAFSAFCRHSKNSASIYYSSTNKQFDTDAST